MLAQSKHDGMALEELKLLDYIQKVKSVLYMFYVCLALQEICT